MRISGAWLFCFRRDCEMNKRNSEKSNSANSVDSVHSVEEPLPNSRKMYVNGRLHADVRVPFREISLAPTKSMNGEMDVNEPVRVYDTSGPWGDPDFHGDVASGLPPLRAKWIRARTDVEEIEGRVVRPIDDGYLSDKHAASRNGDKLSTLNSQPSTLPKRKPLRASTGHPVTQLWYARQGIITNSDVSGIARTIETEDEKIHCTTKGTADTVMNLTTGKTIHATSEWIIRNAPVRIGTVLIYKALEKVGRRAEELTKEIYRDT